MQLSETVAAEVVVAAAAMAGCGDETAEVKGEMDPVASSAVESARALAIGAPTVAVLGSAARSATAGALAGGDMAQQVGGTVVIAVEKAGGAGDVVPTSSSLTKALASEISSISTISMLLGWQPQQLRQPRTRMMLAGFTQLFLAAP